MIVLPKFLFLFQCLPIYLPMAFFKELDKAIFTFHLGRKDSKGKVLNSAKNQGWGWPCSAGFQGILLGSQYSKSLYLVQLPQHRLVSDGSLLMQTLISMSFNMCPIKSTPYQSHLQPNCLVYYKNPETVQTALQNHLSVPAKCPSVKTIYFHPVHLTHLYSVEREGAGEFWSTFR